MKEEVIITKLNDNCGWKGAEDLIINRRLEEYKPNWFRFLDDEDIEAMNKEFFDGYDNQEGFCLVIGYQVRGKDGN